MKDNLIFYGLPEVHTTSPEAAMLLTSSSTSNTDQNINVSPQTYDTATDPNSCASIVKEFIKNTLKISTEIEFDRAHRLGTLTKPENPRPIVVKFHKYSHREIVRNTAFHMKDVLKQHRYGVGVQIPKEWRDAMNAMRPEKH